MMSSNTGIESLGRYALSLILSHLNENEGTSLLITKKRYARSILPLFRLRPIMMIIMVNAKHRHRFIEYPAQDPEVLLERLNTKRLRKRIIQKRGSECYYQRNQTTRELSLSEIPMRLPAHLELLRFLTNKEMANGTTLLVSYPRSGNTLLRNLLERLSGIVTGSDNRPDRKLAKDLATKHNLIGEGVTRNVRVVKTHFPERTGFPCKAQRAILLVRNPYDAIDSYWNLNLTNTHTETVTDAIYTKYQESFHEMAKNEFKVWSQFHRYWLDAPIPILIVRFEDVLSNMEHELKRIALFLDLGDERVLHACGGEKGETPSNLGSYRPRTTNIGKTLFGKSLEKQRYSSELLKDLMSIANTSLGWDDRANMLESFGYNLPDFPNNFQEQRAPAIPQGALGGRNAKSMTINNGFELRSPNDKYGRLMKLWRLERTNDDKNPFPTV